MRITGELLKTERVNQDLTLQQVAHSLKLSTKIVTAIEAGDLSQLPAKTFVRGFVKSYAEFLKLDPESVMRQFQEEMGTTSPLPKVPPPPPGHVENFKTKKPDLRHTSQNYSHTKSVTSASIKQQNLEEENINNKIIVFLFGAFALVILIVLGVKLFEAEPVAPQTLVNNDAENTNVIIPSFDSNTDPNSVVSSTSSTAETAVQASATTTAPPATATPSPVVDNTPATPTAPEDDLSPSPGKPVELILEAKKAVEVYYAKGNTKVFKALKLEPNKIQIIRSSAGLHLKANDGGLFKISVNGVDIGNAGPNNKPVKLTF